MALQRLSSDKTMQLKEIERQCDRSIFLEFGEHSQNSLNDIAGVAPKWLPMDKTVQPDRGDQSRDIFRESREGSQNLQVTQNRVVPRKIDEVLEEVWCEQCSQRISKSEEHSPEWWVKWPMKEVKSKLQVTTHGKNTTSDETSGESSEFSQKSLEHNGNNVSVPKLSWINSMTQIVGLAAAWHQGKVEGDPVGTNTASSPKTNKTSVHAEFNFFL